MRGHESLTEIAFGACSAMSAVSPLIPMAKYGVGVAGSSSQVEEIYNVTDATSRVRPIKYPKDCTVSHEYGKGCRRHGIGYVYTN